MARSKTWDTPLDANQLSALLARANPIKRSFRLFGRTYAWAKLWRTRGRMEGWRRILLKFWVYEGKAPTRAAKRRAGKMFFRELRKFRRSGRSNASIGRPDIPTKHIAALTEMRRIERAKRKKRKPSRMARLGYAKFGKLWMEAPWLSKKKGAG